MPMITFEPSGKSIEIKHHTYLLDTARQAGIEIDSPCGGKGTCGKCTVRIRSGNVETEDTGHLSKTEISNGFVLACQSKTTDVSTTIEIPEQSIKHGGQFSDETDDICLVHLNLFKDGQKPNPLTSKHLITVPSPQLQDGLSDLDRLTRTVQHTCGKKEVIVPLPIIRTLAEVLREDQGQVTVTLAEMPSANRVIAIEPGDQTDRHLGIAVDIGTTTVAVQVIDLRTAQIIETRTAYNDQIECGLDVISRIDYARKPGRLEDLRFRVLNTINRLIKQISKAHDIRPDELTDAVIAGNTTMIHLLLGLKPEYIRLEPYTPTLLGPLYLTAAEIGVDIHPHAWVYISPAVGSYVGGDITAGLLCSTLSMNTGTDSEAVNLFIDIGTNGELVIGNHEFLLGCACSAGPAFEGGGIENGMRAAQGAIEAVKIDPLTGMATYRTIGGGKPKGICGSGMISLIAELFLTGRIDAAGKLNREKPCSSIRINGRQATYILVPLEDSATGEPITITEPDIENVIRAKAAIYSACALMLEQVGMDVENLGHIFIAGGFGRFLDIEKAKIIGLIPDLPKEKFHYIGNASLMGAYRILVSREFKERQSELTRRLTYMELSTDPSYMNQYTAALFLPHTDMKKFPSVTDLISQ
ncbi:MAG: ASKHA domain-containing protein [Candidatus Omnitrophota bacterium]